MDSQWNTDSECWGNGSIFPVSISWTAVAVTPNSICENPEGSKNGEENDPLNTEELETIEQLKQVKTINNNNSSW
jgi:hypothetical protein